MIVLPDHATMGVGDTIFHAGQTHRHEGGGVFVPVPDSLMLKRFDPHDGEPLHRPVA